MADIAVTVIGGYLGAGKTTLVNHILRTADARIAVLVNDFGDINIDEDLIESNDGDTLALANGCICCSLVDGFASALATIRDLEPRPERLVIEASGVADPATVAAYGHAPGLAMDATVVVVDAETIVRKSRDKYVGDTVIGQLRSGDIIVLNKVDLIDRAAVDATRSWLVEKCPDAVIVDAENAVVDPLLLFGTGPRQLSHDAEAHTHDDGHDHAHADSLFESWSWAFDREVTRPVVESMMESLPDSVVRAKGLLLLAEEPERVMALQRVGQRWTLRPFGPRDGHSQSRLVVIGMHGAIDDEWLASHLG